MEEILASIRRIISEDDAPPEAEDGSAAAAAEEEPEPAEPVAAAAEPEPEPVAEATPPPIEVEAAAPAPEPEEDEELELTEKVETLGDLDVYEAPPAPPPVDIAPPAPVEAPAVAGLVSASAATAAAAAFGQLSATLAMPRSDRTLEDVVRELLRPMLQQWLDDNLPAIVQNAVESEVERIARGGGR